MKIKFFHFLLIIANLCLVTNGFSQEPNWEVKPTNYQYSMTFTTFLNVNGTTLTSVNDKVAVFVNDEIRGVANVTFEADDNKYVAYLTAYANTNNEPLTFRIYDSKNDVVVSVSKTINFQIDANLGSVFQAVSIANPALNTTAILNDIIFTNATSLNTVKNGNTFQIELPPGTDITNLKPIFNVIDGAKVYVGNKLQESGISEVDFTFPIIFTVLSEDEAVANNYTVQVSVAANAAATNVVLSIDENTSVHQAPVVLNAQFSNEITDFDTDDFQLTNAVVSKIVKIDNQNFKVEIVPIKEGSFSVMVAPNSVVDADLKVNFPSNTVALNYDKTKPILTNLSYGIENNNEFFEITFSEEIINQDISDFEFTGSNAAIYFKSSLFRVRPNTFRLAIFRIDNNPQEGNIFLKLKSNSDIVDLEGNKILLQEMSSFYRDNQPPTAPTLNDVVGVCNATVSEIPKATDTVSGEILGVTQDALSYTEQGEYSITWTFTDEAGNVATAIQKVIVSDEIAPIAPTLETVSDECSVTITSIPTATDNCAGTIIGETSDPLTYNSQGEHLVTWSFDDGNGNITTTKQKVIIKDVTFPVVPELPDIRAVSSVTLTAPKAQDNCGEVVEGITFDPIFYDEPGEYIVYWFFDDVSGNSIRGSQKVFIIRGTPVAPVLPDLRADCSVTVFNTPTLETISGTITATTADALTYTEQGEFVISWIFDLGNGTQLTSTQKVIVKDEIAPEAPFLNDITSECSYTFSEIPTTYDGCAELVTATTSDPLTYTKAGNYTITWSFDDGNGNVSTSTQNITITDTLAPEKPTLSDVNAQCSVSLVAPTTTDNCAGTITGTTTDPIFYNVSGTYTVNWVFDDGNGNSTTASQNVIISNSSAPIPPELPAVKAACSVTITENPETAGNGCSGTIVGTTTDALYYDEQGEYTIIWTFDYGNGIVLQSNQKVIVKDETLPEIPVLQDVLSECSLTITNIPTTTDNCAGTITGTTTDSLTYNQQGEFSITWTFDDGNGNISTANQKVIVKDETAPVIPDLADISSECSLTITNIPTTTDNCAGTITGTTTDPLTYNQQGEFTIIWTFDDGNGNISTANQKVIVKDETAPVIPDLADISSECSITISDIPTTTDNCEGTITGTTTDNLTYNQQGEFTITWSFDDGNGNISTANQKVIVKDETAPVIPDLADISSECSLAITNIPITTDNCVGNITGTTTDSLIYNQQGEFTIIWTFDDGNGNVSTANQKVIIKDETAPVIPVLQDISSECSIVISDIPTTTDNCAGTITGTTNDSLTYNQQGEFTIIWTFDDGNGNVSTANQKVIVKDETAPEIKAKDFELELDDSGNATLEISDIDNGSTDNCGIASYNLSKTNFAVADLGENDVVFTVTDIHGNSDFVSIKVTVIQKVLSTEDIELKDLIQLYPNPVSRKLFIKIDETVKINKIEIFSINGKTILSKNKSQDFVDVKPFAIGVYFIKITTEKGFLLKKFIKSQY
ncbi:T9SS type A sorting domain-containing protein [Polaribacter sp. Hel_I_88]|uniref:T9SS type A sorting domain-containing protein n=1 Tax=Polaribacter sp. Hel_I_88 TaxID=1250006 RepID=UPI00056679AF|nr:T9SS type A sorting domain-containing protein [Polaribacter sp. Hel_I_88]